MRFNTLGRRARPPPVGRSPRPAHVNRIVIYHFGLSRARRPAARLVRCACAPIDLSFCFEITYHTRLSDNENRVDGTPSI
ncbi:hypothetical protein EVAR_97293_1 [Eumeta japonica]|uniref:Uncharacterized protein n=1 Tax=Eumeta variegata TaxID=151549 RepID=A0A4C1XD83_EUMVA|nr:hypothetical protein EVAR_97293_1 [Eumeta japonica]